MSAVLGDPALWVAVPVAVFTLLHLAGWLVLRLLPDDE